MSARQLVEGEGIVPDSVYQKSAGIIYQTALDEHPEWWEGVDHPDRSAAYILNLIGSTYGVQDDRLVDLIYAEIWAGLT